MYYAQIDASGNAELLDTDVTYPGGFDTIRLLMEEQGYGFIPLKELVLPGGKYDWVKGEFYTPAPPKPTKVEALQAQVTDLSRKLDGQSAILMNLGMALMPPPEVPNTPPDLPPVPPAGTLPSTEDLKGMMGGMTPPDLPTP